MSLLVSGGSGTGTTSSLYAVLSVIYLHDSTGQVWALTVNTIGDLVTTPASGVAFPFIILQDSSNVYWKVFPLPPNGNLDTTNDGIAALNINNLFLTDSSGRNWYVTVLTNGDLDTI